MDRFRQKHKKEKHLKNADKEKPNVFIADVKSIKENLKIKEILRTVKMNSSMRLKAPRGSKVMTSKDFNDNEDFEDMQSSDHELNLSGTASATNPDVVLNNPDNYQLPDDEILSKNDIVNDAEIDTAMAAETATDMFSKTLDADVKITDAEIAHSTTRSTPKDLNFVTDGSSRQQQQQQLLEDASAKLRNRKLSLDHTIILARRDGLSQSELDLHSIGKSPLERKSSFFRKKMDSFFKNTTEIFKRQSLGSKLQCQRRGSMSVSLQSLNENSINNEYSQDLLQRSATSLRSSSTVGGSSSSVSTATARAPADPGNQGGGDGAGALVRSQPALCASLPLGDVASDSAYSLNEGFVTPPAEAPLGSRAISMSSGLDTASGQRRRTTSRSNRVSWVASEGLTNYLRRVVQDEKTKEMQGCSSYSDFSSIPENALSVPRGDSKGRRLSYQRAVSGEDPLPPRTVDSLRRRRYIPEHAEANYELSNHLAEFTKNGVPALKGFVIADIPDEAFAHMVWAERPQNLEEFCDWKKLGPNEEARQAVIRELVTTEADYIRHLMAIVEVFMAAAHALQDAGRLLDIDTEKLFLNIPDVLNASLFFWEVTIYPMLKDAIMNNTAFNTELMSPGFCRFRDIFQPYEKFVNEQSKALDYLRSLSNHTEFMMYLSWCHSQKSCNRLQLSDMLVKPMQRLTKYSLILHRIIAHTEAEPERTSLMAMETFAKNYVLDLNRSIRQREELEKLDALANSIESYEIDFKDDDIDRYFRMYSQLNLRAPMVNCLPSHSRTIIHQGDLRYKDNLKEMEVRAYLLTDMLLICKKLSKSNTYPYKLVRPKYMMDKIIHFPKFSTRNTKELVGLVFVIVDEVGSATHAFMLSETSKDANPHATLKLWEQKIREAKLTYDLGVWFARNPSRDLSEVEMDSSSDYAVSAASKPGQALKQSSDDVNIEKEARERVAAMLHRSMGVSTEYDCSQASMMTDSFDGEASAGTSGAGQRAPGLSLRHRTSTGGSSRNSRLSSFHHSHSGASHEEPPAGPSQHRHSYRAGSSVEHLIPPLNPEDTVTSITVNVVSESESETMVPTPPAQHPTSLRTGPGPGLRSASASYNTLRVQPHSGVLALVHSLPDLTLEPSTHPRPPHTPSASEKLYQSHQELLMRNRLLATHHQYLTPDHRGTSYPPPSPTRASLKRGLAFSYSFKNPPLSKMGHVNSQAQLPAEPAPSSASASVSASASASVVASTSAAAPAAQPCKSENTEPNKSEKKKHISTRYKGNPRGGGSGAGGSGGGSGAGGSGSGSGGSGGGAGGSGSGAGSSGSGAGGSGSGAGPSGGGQGSKEDKGD